MKLKNYGFIAMASGFKPEVHFSILESNDFKMKVVGVENIESAIDAAKRMVRDGIQLIELCGAFDEKQGDKIRASIDYKVPVGVVIHREESIPLKILFPKEYYTLLSRF